jgi:hypothetical protein
MTNDLSITCRSCGSSNLDMILSLGKTPLANALLTIEQAQQAEATYPLDLMLCTDCSLVQITETVPPEQLFGEYFYFSSFSTTMLAHSEKLVNHIIERKNLNENALAVEVASNDGYLLQYYKEQNIPVLGIEPAKNIAKVAEERGIPTLCEFFDDSVAKQLKAHGKQADVIHGNNVLAHVANLNGFVEGLSVLIRDNGVVVIEAPYVKDMIDHTEFDTIYHEHLCYYSLTALDKLFGQHGLTIQDVERVAIHGGSLRIFAGKEQKRSPAVLQLLEEEKAWQVAKLESYREFANKVEQLKHDLLALLSDLKSHDKQIAAYGASAKGATLLNYFGIGKETLEFIVDRSTVKQGYYAPGTHLLIHDPSELINSMPDYTLLLTWNFADEIFEQQSEYRTRGGKFIVPIPELKII